ncbi:MAG: YdcF family protein [Acidobacteria bacterium]|nr:YdcF family protein [Acidobacteriota bacterium]
MKKLLLVGLLLAAVANPFTLSWIASQYVVSDPLEQADAVISLRGSAEEERLRLDEAVELVRKGLAPILLVSTLSRPYYDRPVRQLIEAYLKEKQFPEQQLRFCENNADSTEEEAQALLVCLQQLGAKKAIIVTSEYHTRRTRFLSRRIFARSGVSVLVHPTYNSPYWDTHWWRRRRWTKTFVIETLSLIWSGVEQYGFFWRQPQPALKAVPATSSKIIAPLVHLPGHTAN